MGRQGQGLVLPILDHVDAHSNEIWINIRLILNQAGPRPHGGVLPPWQCALHHC